MRAATWVHTACSLGYLTRSTTGDFDRQDQVGVRIRWVAPSGSGGPALCPDRLRERILNEPAGDSPGCDGNVASRELTTGAIAQRLKVSSSIDVTTRAGSVVASRWSSYHFSSLRTAALRYFANLAVGFAKPISLPASVVPPRWMATTSPFLFRIGAPRVPW